MRRPFQKFDEKSSTYERPNLKWGNGEQPETCTPRRNGDRFECARLASQGGACENGPNSDGTCCNAAYKSEPVLSLRHRRGQLVRWSLAVTIGLLLIVIAGSYGEQFISPGALTAQHAEIADCTGCHSEAETKPAGWLHAAFASYNEISDSRNCLSCHKLGDEAFKPHNKKFDQIAEMTDSRVKAGMQTSMPTNVALSKALFEIRTDGQGEIACRSCHLEHQGRMSDLTNIEDNCQSCHVAKFESFADGHPEFTLFPFQQRTPIIFDHTSHSDKHFWDKSGNIIKTAPTECGDCHQTDTAGKSMQVVSFDKACSSCHLDQTRGEARSGSKGMKIFTMPGLDLETLRDRGVAIGYWPEYADGEITPFTRLLLSENTDFTAALETLGDLDLMDLEEASDEQLTAVKTFAWSLKSLINTLVNKGTMGFKAQLETIAGRELGMTESTALSGLMPADVLKNAQKKWMPGLRREMVLYQSGQDVPIPVSEEETWQDEEESVESSGTTEGGDDGEINTDDDEIATDDDDGEIDTDDDEIATDDDDGEINTDDDEIATDDDDGEIDTDDGEIATDDDDGEISTDDDGDVKISALDPPEMDEDEAPQLSDDEWVAAGGWYQQEFSLDYRSTGHADKFLKSWIEMSAGMSNKEAAKSVFAELSDPQALGQCAKCHSVDEDKNGKTTVNWNPFMRPENIHRFTKFSHQPHFSVISKNGCRDCHNMDSKGDYLGSYKDKNPATFTGNFGFIEKETCATCHAAEKAPAECTTCHNYHIGTFDMSVAPTKMVIPKQSEN